ncbi:MAG: outer membrane protein assembly factor BamD [Planctomycetes bacterium]|nr:outer membrane protein assembly factor BamD [Planctomycetota bacterium]
MVEPERSRPGRSRAIAALLLSIAAGCAAGRDVVDIEDLSEPQLQDEAARALAAGEIDRSIDCAEALLERTSDGARKQAALFVAAEARLADGAPIKAFRHYQSLLRDFPWSPYVPKCEDRVWAIGADYLAEKPWFLFGDLFSGRERGAEVMREFAASFPSSERADDAVAAIAGYRFERLEFEDAVAWWDRVVTDYPDSEWADLAAFRRAESWQLDARGPAYDLTPLLRAARDYRRYLSERPNGERRALALQRASEVDEMIAQGELLRADLYLVREEERGARMHLANVSLAYPSTAAAARARELLEQHGWDLSIHSVDTLQPPPLEGRLR